VISATIFRESQVPREGNEQFLHGHVFALGDSLARDTTTSLIAPASFTNRSRLIVRADGGTLTLTLKRLLAAAVLFVIVPPAAAAHAQGVEGMRSAMFSVGTGVSLAGNAINEGVGTIEGKPSVLVEQSLSNHFSDALRLRFTGSIGLDYNKEVFGTFAYGKYNGTERIVGSVSGYPLLARLSNADAFDVEGGLRYYLRPEGPLRTYVAGTAGLRFLQATDVTFRVVEVGLTLANQPYFKGSALFIIGGDTGVSYDVSDTMTLGAELGLRYQGKPGAEPLFADPRLGAVNDTGSRWSLPISVFAGVRF
jgi:hypothetical protein